MKLQKALVEDRKQKKAMERSASCECECVTTVENTELKVDDTKKDIIFSSSSSGCSTPKAKRFRIPKVLTCPPAPKKRKVTPPSACSSINRSPISLFSSPDIELFFFSALNNVSV